MESHPPPSRFFPLFCRRMVDTPATSLTDSWRSAWAPSLFVFPFFPLFFLFSRKMRARVCSKHESERRCVLKCARVLPLRVEPALDQSSFSPSLFLYLSLSLFRFLPVIAGMKALAETRMHEKTTNPAIIRTKRRQFIPRVPIYLPARSSILKNASASVRDSGVSWT